MMVGGGDSKKRGTPSTKKPSSDDSGNEVDGPPKKPVKKAKDSTPLNMFHAKVARPRARRLPQRKSRLRCAVITACVYVSSFFASICTHAHTVLRRCETGALFRVLVILGTSVPKFIDSPVFYPCCAISFAGIVALIYYCIGCTGGASVACRHHWWCIISHASHTITVTGSAAAVTKSKPEFCMCLHVILLASFSGCILRCGLKCING